MFNAKNKINVRDVISAQTCDTGDILLVSETVSLAVSHESAVYITTAKHLERSSNRTKFVITTPYDHHVNVFGSFSIPSKHFQVYSKKLQH